MENDEILYTIVYNRIDNEGEEYDNEENFCGFKTRHKILIEENLTLDKLADILEHIRNVAADYGDGVTNSKPIVIFESKTKEHIPIRMIDNYIDDRNNREDEECCECNLTENECECED